MRSKSLAVAALAFVTGTATAADIVELRLSPAADTTIFADVSGFDRRWDDVSDGQGGSLWMSTTAGGVLRRSLIRFDLSSVPDGMAIVSASLTLYESRARDEHGIQLHRMLAAWGEGASDGGGQGEGDQAGPGDATWRWRDYLVSEWGQRGGDFTATPSAALSVGLPNTRYTWTGAGLAADVHQWLQQADTNHGWILIGPEIDAQNAKRFDSGESLIAGQRPLLTLVLSPVPEPGAALLWALGLFGLLAGRPRHLG